MQDCLSFLYSPAEQHTTNALAATLGLYRAKHVAANFAHTRRQVVRVHHANELIATPGSERVIREINGVRLEVFANLFTCLILRPTVSKISFVEQKRECVVVGVAKRALGDGHLRLLAPRGVVSLWGDGDHNFTDVGVGFHMAMCFDNLLKREPRIDNRPQHASIKIG